MRSLLGEIDYLGFVGGQPVINAFTRDLGRFLADCAGRFAPDLDTRIDILSAGIGACPKFCV